MPSARATSLTDVALNPRSRKIRAAVRQISARREFKLDAGWRWAVIARSPLAAAAAASVAQINRQVGGLYLGRRMGVNLGACRVIQKDGGPRSGSRKNRRKERCSLTEAGAMLPANRTVGSRLVTRVDH